MRPATRLRLHVVPGAKRSGVVGRHGDAWKIRVTAAPERGAANDAVVRLLAETLAVPARAVSIVSGHGAREKTVEVAGIDTLTIESALEKEAGLRRRLRRRPQAVRASPARPSEITSRYPDRRKGRL